MSSTNDGIAASAGRKDVICVAAGTSRAGIQFIKDGMLHAVSYQSAEGDGALGIEIAARWFRGEKIEHVLPQKARHNGEGRGRVHAGAVVRERAAAFTRA
jgi:ABC-type sugar transport system substrate-binding protein